MAEQEGGGKGIGAALAGVGLIGVAALKVCSHAPVDDVARLGGKALSEGGAVVDVGRHVPAPGTFDEVGRVADAADVVDITANVGAAMYDGLVARGDDDGIWLGDLAASDSARVGGHPGKVVGFVVREGADLAAWEASCRAAQAECWVYVGPSAAPEGAAITAWNASGETPVAAEGFAVSVFGG